MKETHTPRNTFTIDVYPHIKKFILKYYQATEPIKTEQYSTIGDMVTLCLMEPGEPKDNDQFRDRLKETLTLTLSSRQAKRSPRKSKLLQLNTKLDRLFKEHLLTWIHATRKDGVPPYTACKIFLNHYQIDESEYSLEAAHRYWQRHKKKNDVVLKPER